MFLSTGPRVLVVAVFLCGIIYSAFGNVIIPRNQIDLYRPEVLVPIFFRCTVPDVLYKSHLQNIGWQVGWFKNGEMAGTTGQSRRLEAIQIKLEGATIGMGVTYSAHVQNIGWQGWVNSGEVAGTTGRSLRLEAIRIQLTNNPLGKMDILYRAHLQGTGWQGWKKNGEIAGTTGQSRRLEAIEIRIVNNACKR